MNIREVLNTYWGYSEFRPLQEDIIRSVLDGNDTLALLPTGGGKSICFQVPALAQEGICIVVSPLIALMKDQVENLRQRGIKASAIYSGLSFQEIKITLNNCVHGDIRFLYLSPERLRSELVKEHLKQMRINLLAVDEAHCISQWGYDFRPEYLQIAEIRELFPKVPVLALTASATQAVVADIQDKLAFKKKNVFSKSFERPNLSYVVNYTEDKRAKLLHILSRVNGSALIYVRNRKKTREISDFLRQHNISSDYYHAGLSYDYRVQKQNQWIHNQTRVMVCTNAFGMGIDKPDVRLVIHFEIPESPESYYQEAGRAGRDGKRAYAVILFGKPDEHDAHDRLKSSFPENGDLIRIYHALCDHYAIPFGNIPERSYDLDLPALEEKYKIQPALFFNSIKALESCDLIAVSDSFFEPSKVRILAHHDLLYKFQVENPTFDDFLKLLLRSYGGLFDQHTAINESTLAKRGHTDEQTIIRMLNKLSKLGILEYAPRKDKPQLVFLSSRVREEEMPRLLQVVNIRRKNAAEKLDAIIAYANNDSVCRSMKLVACFDQTDSQPCGHCDVCLEQKKVQLKATEFERLVEQIKYQCLMKAVPVKELTHHIPDADPEIIIEVVRYLLDNDKLRYNEQQHLEWKA